MTELYLPLRPATYTASSAAFSPCGTYRYRLVRVWDPALPSLCMVMLNPSKADDRRNDATIRRCIRFAQKWGYGGIVVRNLYALVSTDPDQLWSHPDPIGPDNDAELALCCQHDLTVLAWGANAAPQRAHQVAARLWEASRHHQTSLAVLGWTAAGQPRHPVRMRADTMLEGVTPASSGDAHETEDPRWAQLFYGDGTRP
ncbi:DUF1643 domain-containing protein [Mycobacterium hubeiense]|uniref:DUF1643 domain-containing protein n=1 Tax=Mycobacterium hubeiense TaxID=1867256 RepID=UPI000C7F0B8E|nr:DUF1643 domain-containing protein [Mycobacterium sp. QGD 101]